MKNTRLLDSWHLHTFVRGAQRTYKRKRITMVLKIRAIHLEDKWNHHARKASSFASLKRYGHMYCFKANTKNAVSVVLYRYYVTQAFAIGQHHPTNYFTARNAPNNSHWVSNAGSFVKTRETASISPAVRKSLNFDTRNSLLHT